MVMLLVGIVRRPHGLKGELSVEAVTAFPERFAPGAHLLWQLGAASRDLEVVSVRGSDRRWLLSFAAIEDVDAARALAGGELFVPEEEAFAPPPGFYYSHEIEGFRCEDRRKRSLGVVAGLSQTVAGPILTIATAPGKEALVPFVEEMILEIDRAGRRIVLELPEGLLDL